MIYNIVYHKRDLDGHCSGALARYHWEVIKGKTVKMFPYDYGEPFPHDEIKDKDPVIMVDVTTNPYGEMTEIDKRYTLTVIDHHRSFLLDPASKKLKGLMKDGIAACQLVWHHYFKTDMPELVRLLGDYDVWKNSNRGQWNNHIMPVQMGIKMLETDPNTDAGFELWKKYFDSYLPKKKSSEDNYHIDFVNGLKLTGRTIIEYQKMQDKRAIDFYSFDAVFQNLNAICLNNTRFNSQVYESVWDNAKYDLMLAWENVRGTHCTVSLYTDKPDLNVSELAKEFGGGGHAQAAGFQCKNVIVKETRDGRKVIRIETLGPAQLVEARSK